MMGGGTGNEEKRWGWEKRRGQEGGNYIQYTQYRTVKVHEDKMGWKDRSAWEGERVRGCEHMVDFSNKVGR